MQIAKIKSFFAGFKADISIPSTYIEAIRMPQNKEWKEATNTKIKALNDNKT